MKNISTKALIFSLIIGLVLGFAQYWSEITNKHEIVNTQKSNSTVDEKTVATTANLEQILALEVPKPSDKVEIWQEFLISLEGIQLPKHTRPKSNISPLLAFYVYVAKYQPEIFYQQMDQSGMNESFISNLLRLGLLPDWYNQIENPERWFLLSRNAIKSYAVKEGLQNAKATTAKAFLSEQPRSVYVDLTNLRFASSEMSNSEMTSVIRRLLKGYFKYDPRKVESLIGLPQISNSELVRLIKNNAYSSKSMSSYMTTAVRLGDEEYIYTMANDAENNAKQPTNFYCSACGLSLYSDGMIGQPLIDAAKQSNIQVEQENNQLIINLKNEALLSGGAL